MMSQTGIRQSHRNPARGRWLAALFFACCWPFAVVPVAAQNPPPQVIGPQPAPGANTTSTTGSLEDVEKLLTRLVVGEAGLEWSDDRKWGQQEKVWGGVRLRRDGNRLETERVWRMVNHGSWEKYGAQVQPGAENFRITLPRIETTPDGASLVTVAVRAQLDIEARQAQWVRGVQMYSLSASGTADVGLEIAVRLDSVPDYSEFPPAIVLQPEVTSADIHLYDFRIDRVSKVGGEFAQQVSKVARKKIEEKIAEKKTGLPAKLNRQIEKNRDHLRFSLNDLILDEWLKSKVPDASSSAGENGSPPPTRQSSIMQSKRP